MYVSVNLYRRAQSLCMRRCVCSRGNMHVSECVRRAVWICHLRCACLPVRRPSFSPCNSSFHLTPHLSPQYLKALEATPYLHSFPGPNQSCNTLEPLRHGGFTPGEGSRGEGLGNGLLNGDYFRFLTTARFTVYHMSISPRFQGRTVTVKGDRGW